VVPEKNLTENDSVLEKVHVSCLNFSIEIGISDGF